MRARKFCVLLGATLAVLVLAHPRAAEAQTADMNGKWALNLDESEDGQAKFQAAIREARESSRRGGGRPPSGGRGGDPEAMRETMRMLMNAAMRLNIVVEASTVTLVTAEGSRVIVYPDGRKVETSIEGAGTIETKAQWKGDKLVVERKIESGMKVTSEYELKSDGAKLHVKRKFAGGRLPTKVEVLSVYDADNGAN